VKLHEERAGGERPEMQFELALCDLSAFIVAAVPLLRFKT
jgi:hypothetical protein